MVGKGVAGVDGAGVVKRRLRRFSKVADVVRIGVFPRTRLRTLSIARWMKWDVFRCVSILLF